MMNMLKVTEFLIKGVFTVALLLAANTAYGQGSTLGMSIACSNDHVFTWYGDRTVSVGTSENLGAYQPPHAYFLPPGKRPEDIVGIGIAGNDHVYAWYRDNTVSSGTSIDLDQYRAPYRYTLAPGKTPNDVVGIDIACSNDHVYVWYRDGTVSSGTSDHLDKYSAPHRYSLAPGKSPNDLVGMGIAGNDHVYAWYRDRTVSSGTSDDLDKYRPLYSYVLDRGSCDIYANSPAINRPDRMVYAIGSRGPSCESRADIVVRLRAIDPDANRKTLAEKRGTGTNLEVPVKYACTGNGGLILFVEVESQGRTVKSPNTSIAYCF
jgi:hypothetical protein